jgi:sugar (pentulose or hexulose) kinase
MAAERGVSAETLLDEAIRDTPPGAYGLVLQPYWSPNRVYSGREGRGAIVGFADVHARRHVYRAILEGLMYALKDGARLMEGKMKTTFRSLRVSGGGAQSPTALQIAADVFDLPVERPAIAESALLGAAMNAAVGLGYYPDYPSAVSGMTRAGKIVQPVPRNRDIYGELYERVYRKLYGRLEPLYKEMWDIAERYPDEMRPPSHETTGAAE